MEKFLFLVLMLMLISRLFHAGSHTIILMLMLMLVLIAQVGTRLNGFSNILTVCPRPFNRISLVYVFPKKVAFVGTDLATMPSQCWFTRLVRTIPENNIERERGAREGHF